MYAIEQRDEQLLGTTAAITYHLGFHRASQHIVNVRMRIDNVTGDSVVVAMPSWSPGSYMIRNYAGHQGNVSVWIGSGPERQPTTSQWRDKASLVIDTQGAGTIEIDYVVYAHERTVRTSHVNRFHAFLMLTTICMYVEGRTNEIHHVVLTHDGTLWPNVSTALSLVTTLSTTGVVLGALNYDVLADSPIEIGSHTVHLFDVAGATHEVAISSNHEIDAQWLVTQLKRIVCVEAAMFDGVPYDRYVFMIQLYPGLRGGLEHARSSVNASDPVCMTDKSKVIDLLSLLCHEFFHLWNVKRIRPIELGPFDYSKENYTPMLWLAEGLTSYYDDLITYRCGFTTAKEYLEILSKDHIGKLATVPGRFALSTRDSSSLAWLKLYMQSPDANNRFPSYYLKGGVVILLLDVYIIDNSNGEHCLDDAMRGFWQRYIENPQVGMTEEDCIALIESTTHIQIRQRLLDWLNGTSELPYDEILEAVGLRVETAPAPLAPLTIGDEVPFAQVAPQAYMGWTLAEANGRIVVQAVADGSPAAQAGVGIDDEIIALDGIRIATIAHIDQYCGRRIDKGATLTAHCDGRTYSTTVVPVSLPQLRLIEIEMPSARQKQMRDRWLRRML